MRKTKIKSLIILSALLGCSIQSSIAQNTERRNMNQDSTSLVPSGMATVPTNQTFTSTYSTVMGACGADNGKTLSSAPTNLCNTGTPSTVYKSGSSIIWSCTGNYGVASTSSCGATLIPSTGTVNVNITLYGQCTGYRLVVQNRTVPVTYKVVGTTATYTGTTDPYVGFYGSAIGIEGKSIISYSISGKPPGVTFPSLSVVANDGCSG